MKEWTITYTGKWVSLNAYYQSRHWAVRNKLKNEWKEKFGWLLKEAGVQWMDAFCVSVKFNSRLDTENVIGGLKILVDTMKGVYIEDDTKKYYKGVSIEPDETLDKNTYVITISEWQQEEK